MNDSIIEVKNLHVRFNDITVLENINFKIEKNQIIAIIGPNGSGKTSLLKAMLGLIDYTGSVSYFGKKITQKLTKIGYVPQKFDFDRSIPITVYEFISFSGADDQEIIKVLKEVGMEEWKNKIIGDLSGGQLQRVLIANALTKNPQILFLDEPLAGIDIEGAEDFYKTIKKLNIEKNVTIFLVSHEINMVYKFVDQIICLNRDLICQGTPKETITKEVLEKLYGKEIKLQPHNH
jgi:zinc transport system ATP-binding protein